MQHEVDPAQLSQFIDEWLHDHLIAGDVEIKEYFAKSE